MSTQTISREQSRVQSPAMNQQPQGQQSLVRTEMPVSHLLERIRQQPRELVAYLAQLQEHYHVIGAGNVTDGFSECYSLSVSPVLVNTKVNEWGQGPETYFDFAFMKAPRGQDRESGEWKSDLDADTAQRALSKSALDRIASAAGVEWVPYPIDNRDPNYCLYVAVGRVKLPDGTPSEKSNHYVVDLRDGSAQIGGWTSELWRELMDRNEAELTKAKTPAEAKQLRKRLDWDINGWSDRRVMQARRHIHTNAESKAKNRVVREFGVRQVYTVKELRDKPFLVLKAVISPSLMSDPAVKQRVVDIAFLGNRLLHARAQGAPASLQPVAAMSASDDVIDVRPVPAPSPTTSVPATTASDTATTGNVAAAAQPSGPADTPVQVTRIVPETGISKGIGWSVWWFTFSDERVAGTDDEELVQWGRKHKDDRAWVVPSIEKTEKGTLRLLELQVVPAPGASTRVESAFPL